MCEMIVHLVGVNKNIEEVLKTAEIDGYITTQTISDILKPVLKSEGFIISELAWWPYAELKRDINTNDDPSLVEPGYIIVRFPEYHTSPKPDNELPSKEETSFDAVHRPSHYTEGRKYEPRKVIADWGLNFNLGNAVKYISRAGRKGDKIEDLRKAIQYIEFEIEELDPHYMSSENRIMSLKNRLNAVYGVNKEEK